MNQYSFELQDEDSLIIVDCKIQHHNFALAVDTGASHTIIDLTALFLIGFTMNDIVRKTQFETGNGTVDAFIFQAAKLSALGKTLMNFEVCSYDFIANATFSDFDGVLGLDFFRGSELVIDLKNFIIQVK